MRAHPKGGHQLAGVRERPRAGREARHGVGEHVRAGEADPVHDPGADDERVRRIKAPGDPDDELLHPGGAHAGLEAANLDVVDLLAAFAPPLGVCRDERKTLDLTAQGHRTPGQPRTERKLDPAEVPQPLTYVADRVPVAARARPVADESVEVDVGEDERLPRSEALRLGL